MADNKPAFRYQEMFELAKSKTKYRNLTKDHVKVVKAGDREILEVEPEALTRLAREAVHNVSFLLRPAHQEQVASIFTDPEASENDKFIAYCMLENAAISARFELPFCQDTGTATVVAKKGEQVWTRSDDMELISKGVWETYTTDNLRYSQTIPLDMYKEKNSGNNLPAQIDLYSVPGMKYEFLFVTKGGGSANKTMLYQETKATLTPEKLKPFLIEKMRSLGTAACPPYHIAFVIGGTSAEMCLKTVKLASSGYLDGLPETGSEGGRAFRDAALEQELLEASYKLGYGAQFGGKYFAHDFRVIRLPRHGASAPIGMGLSCSADRNILARIDKDGLWLEKMETDPGRLIPEEIRSKFSSCSGCISIDLNKPMKDITTELSKYPVGTRLSLNGKIVVARDIAHSKFKELLDKGKPLPEYLKNHPIYYAGPAKQPKNKPSGSFGPTTAGRMDSYVDLLQTNGASLVMIAKGNRSNAVTDACKRHGGFYLGSPGGPAALLAERNIKKVETLDYPELGMEAVWAIEVEDFPAFILVDDKGGDFFLSAAK
ncbi:MAG: fumarate hydratase [Elusimicrobia bacterium RIFOXYA12_FULL_51_18]|nr:MAG: fumarate hydratase [Elusimicrobia bacterium RIFOXYA12_FULL_51_18]OGS28362.1 MAG: fumarate hydratase [Elusimicrobia bacterium RIFOXYA2_FULL_53_38]